MSGNHSLVVSVRRVCLAGALLLALPACSGAAERIASAESVQVSLAALPVTSPLFAGWLDEFTSSLSTRSNVVRVCIAVLALALFIMMKKFDGGSGVRGQESEHKPDAQARDSPLTPDP